MPELAGSSIAILTPSRGRPDRVGEMIDAIERTADGPVAIYLGVDEDQRQLYEPVFERDVHIAVHTRMRLAAWTNRLAEQALADGHQILGFLGDDHRPRTPGWDTSIKQAFEGMGSGLVYCADGLQNRALPTAPFWTADVIRALGFYYPPVLVHLYADNYWLLLATDLRRCVYLPDVYVEHCHPSANKAAYDDTYRENDTWYTHDNAAFQRFVTHEHPAVLERVRAKLDAR